MGFMPPLTAFDQYRLNGSTGVENVSNAEFSKSRALVPTDTTGLCLGGGRQDGSHAEGWQSILSYVEDFVILCI